MALNMKTLATRAATAAAGALVIGLLLLFLPPWCFHGFIAVIGLLGVREFSRISQGFGYRLFKVPVVFAIFYGLSSLYVPALELAWLPYPVLLLATFISLIPPNEMQKTLPQVGLSITASAYLCMALISLVYLFQISQPDQPNLGRHLVMACILIVWMGDSAAYLGGSIFGRHKIAPVVSPKKSWEGTIANLFGNAAGVFLLRHWVLPQMTLLQALLLTLVFGILGFFGDLVESSWKRGSDIKDSGQLFPGHGGVMDRIDSIFLTAPVFYVFVKYWVLP